MMIVRLINSLLLFDEITIPDNLISSYYEKKMNIKKSKIENKNEFRIK
jgi:hypothetical protein